MKLAKSKILLLLIIVFINCEGEVGPQGIGLNSLTNVTNEPSGLNCENGGIKFEVGIDTNENGVLDVDEIKSTNYICNGVDGAISLTIVTTEPSGTNCESGGLKIDSGIDVNGDGTLDNTEISATAYVCNGVDGNNTLTKITNEAAGVNCTNGGLKIDSGVDANGNGILDDTEISATAYVCNGDDGNNTLIKTTNEDAGINCENGGLKIDSGIDINVNGILDDSEISATAYVCNGIFGIISLTKITNEAAGTNCENGGLKIDSGVDIDDNQTLDDNEITATTYVCNGLDGNNSLIKLNNEPAGTNCENGGLKIDSGVDTDGDGTLDDSEIIASAYVCNGLDGNNSLTKITDETAGVNCENGGLKIDSGVDTDEDGILDTDEVEITRYVCNGADGAGFDEQIILTIVTPNSGQPASIGFITSSDTYEFAGVGLIDFDKRAFSGVDSIVFVCNAYTVDASNKFYVELYNATDNVSIGNSEIMGNLDFNNRMFLNSPNIFADLPDKEIDLGIRIRSETSGESVRSGSPFLILYRSN